MSPYVQFLVCRGSANHTVCGYATRVCVAAAVRARARARVFTFRAMKSEPWRVCFLPAASLVSSTHKVIVRPRVKLKIDA